MLSQHLIYLTIDKMINIEEFSTAEAIEAIKNYHENERLNPPNMWIISNVTLFETTKTPTGTIFSLHSFSKEFKIDYSRHFIICDTYKFQWLCSCQHDDNVSTVAKKLFAIDYSIGDGNSVFLFDCQLGKIILRGKFHEDAYTDPANIKTIEKYVNNTTTLTNYVSTATNDVLTNKKLKQIIDFYYASRDSYLNVKDNEF
jgi:hypothetical protein